ncbi:HD domain-containing phosphohydrolase [Sedimenticola sp.]|uniref:HD domain-containing phosphohydrolase n=1 Tax=Sedimenticola sp. TaxID=1940285 RepID=UPI002583AB88|nr:HD domain-containing phosphohydrolase [Sedimenticola sp.]MCW8903644.1 response regulator [Sedimenticola sp.]
MSIEERILESSILIVDDTADNVDLLIMMLEANGYTNLKGVTDSREVNDLCTRHTYDLILLDIRMPHLDGFQVMEQLRYSRSMDYLPILVLTAQNDIETRTRALELGAKDFVTKPFDRTEIQLRIHNILEVRQLYKEKQQHNLLLQSIVDERTRELQQKNDELQSSRHNIIQCLGRAGEYRDNETGMHVIRMASYARLLADALGKDKTFVKDIWSAATMHDIGKIGIPDHVLLKPGKFEPDEWEIMQRHTLIGAEILGEATSDIMRMARSVVLTHHERWDGKGYPNGLKGEEIPIEGRIVAVCDVFDALTSDRPYKKAWSVQEAVDYLNENSGTAFDPELVFNFLQILPMIHEVMAAFPDQQSGS